MSGKRPSKKLECHESLEEKRQESCETSSASAASGSVATRELQDQMTVLHVQNEVVPEHKRVRPEYSRRRERERVQEWEQQLTERNNAKARIISVRRGADLVMLCDSYI